MLASRIKGILIETIFVTDKHFYEKKCARLQIIERRVKLDGLTY